MCKAKISASCPVLICPRSPNFYATKKSASIKGGAGVIIPKPVLLSGRVTNNAHV